MSAFSRSILAATTIVCGAPSNAGQDAVTIVVGEPISSEAQVILDRYQKCGSDGEAHVAQDGRSSSRTWTCSYRSPDSGDFLQIVTTNDEVVRLYWQPAATEKEDYWDTEFQQVSQITIVASTLRVTRTVPFQPKKKAEQAGSGQPATRPESDPEGGDKPQPESEGRSR